jgi:hypothetical protein
MKSILVLLFKCASRTLLFRSDSTSYFYLFGVSLSYSSVFLTIRFEERGRETLAASIKFLRERKRVVAHKKYFYLSAQRLEIESSISIHVFAASANISKKRKRKREREREGFIRWSILL